jgi:hypothetical protein
LTLAWLRLLVRLRLLAWLRLAFGSVDGLSALAVGLASAINFGRVALALAIGYG